MSRKTEIKKTDLEFIGYDLGHGETALGRAYAKAMREPEILEFRGERTFVTAVARSASGTKSKVSIGAEAVNISAMGKGAQVWVKFKGRDLTDPSVTTPTQLFTQTLIADLTSEKKIQGAKHSRFVVGCPSGWSPADRMDYASVFKEAGLKTVSVAPESRAALMTALE